MDDIVQGDARGNIVVRNEDSVADHTEPGETEYLIHSLSGLSVAAGQNPQASKEDVSSDKQVHLSDLSNDLLLHIFSICDALTVGKLRQCSKEFHKLSRDRVMWLEILKRACEDLNQPISSFPQSAFSNRDIELFATARIRFQTVLRRVDDKKPIPRAMVRMIDIHGPVYSFAQSTDGRFLFVVHGAELQVWCLQTQTPTLVSSFDIGIPEDGWSRLNANIETDHSFLVYILIIGRSKVQVFLFLMASFFHSSRLIPD
ncbi:hypothetical protein DL96DRAFT_784433 [Flagelloscypha sp. PMI_526]|nr:hypothetical protein DL96DRAFT_784433 [Flagelloscypha sp. PMI_526]